VFEAIKKSRATPNMKCPGAEKLVEWLIS